MKGYKKYSGKTVKIMCCSACNNKCSHCYINYNGDFDPDILLDVVNKLKNKFEVRINGTEPLLNENYLKSFSASGEELVLTNGLVFKNNLQLVDKIIESGIKRICVSYHFLIQNKLSEVNDCYLDYIIPKIRQKGIDVELMCTISSSNYDKILDFCKKTVDLGANYIYFIEYMKKENSTSTVDKKYLLTDEMGKRFFEQLERARKKYSKDTLMVTRCGNFGKNPYSSNKNIYCPAYDNLVVMTPNYKIYPCNFLISPSEEIGFYEDGEIFVKENYISCNDNCLYCEKRRCNK